MVSLKKYVPCKCGANNSFEFNSEMQVEDLTLSARCPSCGASVSICISALLATPSQPLAPVQQTTSAVEQANSEHVAPETQANVEQAVRDLFR
jgi:hypothetical protein